MRRGVAGRLRDLCAAERLDAIVACSPENVAYAAGFVIPSQPLMRRRHAAVVVTADGRDAVVCVDMEESTVRAATPQSLVKVWGEFTGSPWEALASAVAELGLLRGRIGVELDFLPVSDHEELTSRLPDAILVGADKALERARMVKTPSERQLLSRLSRIADGAIGDAFAAVKAGDTEMDIASALTQGVYQRGADQFKLMIVATGERSELPNVGPSTRTLVPGDVCRVEIFAVAGGYQAGVCRTAVVGEPSPAAEKIYQNLVECKRQVVQALRPGVAATEVYRVFRETFDRLGLPPISFVGHGIGTCLHELPYLGPFSDQVVEAGMVLGIEPLVYRSGHGFGMQIKDMVAIGADGVEVLSDVTDTGALWRIEA